MGAILRKYGVAATFIVPIIKAGSVDHAVAADWTPAAGDVKISQNEGAAANIGTLPSYVAGLGWKFTLSATEEEAARISVQVTDSATKAVEDQHILIETYGHASAQHAFDLGTALTVAAIQAGLASQTSVDDVPTVAEFEARTLPAADYFDAANDSVALTTAQVTALVAALEAEIADDATGEAIKQAIVDKLVENLPDLDDLTLAAIGNAARDAILDRVLATNHDTPGTLGLFAQKLNVTGTLAHSDAADTYKADVSGLSTFDPAEDAVNVGSILGTALSEDEAGQVAAGLSFFFDVGTPTQTMEDVGGEGEGASVHAITVVVASAIGAGEVLSNPITLYQYESKTFTFALVDQDGNSINEDGDSFVLVVYHLDRVTELFRETGTASTNQVTITVSDDNTATAGDYYYRLWNTTEDAVRAQNTLEIKPGVDSAEQA